MVSEFIAHPYSKRRIFKHDIIALGTEVGNNGRELKKKKDSFSTLEIFS